MTTTTFTPPTFAPPTFNLAATHPSWQPSIAKALRAMSSTYLQQLQQSTEWLPGPRQIFNAFSLPMNQVNYVLFGESPYPRSASANGYAFWDAAVGSLWSSSGLSKEVNRATSLRNILKMLLVAAGYLTKADTTQPAIAQLDKSQLVQTNHEFFTNFLRHGFLLLNATLVLQSGPPQKDAAAWQPFLRSILQDLLEQRPKTKLLLLGRIASAIDGLIEQDKFARICAEHPYNLSFITNQAMLDFFQPFHLLDLAN